MEFDRHHSPDLSQSGSTLPDATLDGTPSGPSLAGDHRPRVKLVEGSTPQLTAETYTLLATRLRASALFLFAGFAAFLVRAYLDPAMAATRGTLLHYFHIAVTVSLAVFAAQLCARCPGKLKYLRWYEVLVFGMPAAFFAYLQYERMVFAGLHNDAATMALSVNGMAAFWLFLIFTYSMFIPNSWQRAATIAGSIALAPILVTLLARAQYESVAAMVPPNAIVELSMIVLLAAGGGAYGSQIIRGLREAAFEAEQLGQYRLKERLGTGGMGEVYLAEHQLLKRPCAVKIIRPEKAGDPKILARFEREVRATARLSHWNTVEIFDYGRTDDGTFYYVMEYLPGMSVAEVVQQHGAMPAERVIHLLRQTCHGLREAHQMGLIHRDIKPGNIFVAERGGIHDVAKLLDFGLVKPIDPRDAEQMQLTHEGGIAGSPLYISPEQAMGEDHPDERTDIYALGAVAYFMLTERPPFDGTKPMKVLLAHAHEEVVPPSQLRPEVPADLEQVVLRCLAKRPEDRYPDADSLAAALDACEAAGHWTEDDAARWWQGLGQPALAVAGS